MVRPRSGAKNETGGFRLTSCFATTDTGITPNRHDCRIRSTCRKQVYGHLAPETDFRIGRRSWRDRRSKKRLVWESRSDSPGNRNRRNRHRGSRERVLDKAVEKPSFANRNRDGKKGSASGRIPTDPAISCGKCFTNTIAVELDRKEELAEIFQSGKKYPFRRVPDRPHDAGHKSFRGNRFRYFCVRRLKGTIPIKYCR